MKTNESRLRHKWIGNKLSFLLEDSGDVAIDRLKYSLLINIIYIYTLFLFVPWNSLIKTLWRLGGVGLAIRIMIFIFVRCLLKFL